MKVANTRLQLQSFLSKYRSNNKIAFVPTMGALHDGHLSLIDTAREHADIVVVSIFVNPKQFAPGEDFADYPRVIESDILKLQSRKVEILYKPDESEIYGEGFDQHVYVGDIGRELEGVTRPHFFDGVATVVSQLFAHVKPDVAVFGKKDFQQLYVIKQLNCPVQIIGATIIREVSGLAMSSRNLYLSKEEKITAASLHKTLLEVAKKIGEGKDVSNSINWGKSNLIESGFSKVDYLELRDIETLAKVDNMPAQLLAAVYLGGVRLIDNIEVGML